MVCALKGAFETCDFFLAYSLRCVGYELLDLRMGGRRREFIFGGIDDRPNDVMAFYGDGASLRPPSFSSTIKNMKDLRQNA